MIVGYEHPYVTVDMIIFTVDREWNLKVLLTQRTDEPFKNKWSLPGGFVNIDENLDDCALRKLQEKVDISFLKFEQLYTFGSVHRDPRDRVISVAYFSLVPYDKFLTLKDNAKWFNVKELPELAFDHNHIIETAIRRIQGKLEYTSLAFELLKDRENFTIYELQKINEVILEKKLDVPNFRRSFFKRYLDTGVVKETGETSREFSKTPSKLYKCVKAINEM